MGQVDIITGGTDVTVSWNHFSDHRISMLVGLGSVAVPKSASTVHHNYFSGNSERMPRSRARVHSYNNYIRGWKWDPVYASDGGEIYSEAKHLHPQQ